MTVTATSIDLTWSAPAGGGAVVAYDILMRETGVEAFAIVASVNDTSFAVEGLVPSTSYDFAVYARNQAGPGGLSGIVTQETLGAVPNAVRNLAGAAGSPAYSAVDLTWDAPATNPTHGTASYYKVYRRLYTGMDDPWTLVDANVLSTGKTVTGLSHHTAHDFLVVPYNDAGGAEANESVPNFVTDYAAPNVPTGLVAAPVDDGTVSKLAVTWTASATDGTHDAATGYDVRHSPAGAGTWTTLVGVGSGAVITGLSAGTSYDVQVRATNGSTTSPSAWSSSATVSTWTNVITVANPPPATPITNGSGPIVQVDITGTFTVAQAVWDASGTVAPASGWADSLGPFSTFEAGWFLGGGASTAAGTAYLWVRTRNAGSVTIGRISYGPYTFT